jgi:hypothetical protein
MKLKIILSLKAMVFCTSLLFAHSPDLSSIMLYEQNGKFFIVIKSSLTAFEGEVTYHNGKNSYKSPQGFIALTLAHFKKNCSVLINRRAVRFKNPQVQLGHETTLFSEIENMPAKITSIYLKNTMFKHTPNHQCEWIVSIGDYPQKQAILSAENKYELSLRAEKNALKIEEVPHSISIKNKIIFIGILLGILSWIGFVLLAARGRRGSALPSQPV